MKKFLSSLFREIIYIIIGGFVFIPPYLFLYHASKETLTLLFGIIVLALIFRYLGLATVVFLKYLREKHNGQ